MALNALFYPKVKFESLFIPYIYKEIYFDGIYVDILNQKKDLTILDVGANIGIVTDYMRPYAKKIYAIEPASENFEALKKNKEFNNWDNVEIYKLALADKNGEMRLAINDKNHTMDSLMIGEAVDKEVYKIKKSDLMLRAKGYNKWEKVKTMRFDTFMKKNNIDKVDFCKFDVEGAEDIILRSEGFKNVVDKIQAIEVEFHFPTYPELVKYMESFGYQARRYDCSAIVVLFIK